MLSNKSSLPKIFADGRNLSFMTFPPMTTIKNQDSGVNGAEETRHNRIKLTDFHFFLMVYKMIKILSVI